MVTTETLMTDFPPMSATVTVGAQKQQVLLDGDLLQWAAVLGMKFESIFKSLHPVDLTYAQVLAPAHGDNTYGISQVILT